MSNPVAASLLPFRLAYTGSPTPILETVRDKSDVFTCPPECPDGRCLATQDRRSHVFRGDSGKDRTRAPDCRCGMGVTGAGLGPMIDSPHQGHGQLRGADAGKAPIQGLNAVRVYFRLRQEPIHDRALDAMAEDPVKGMSDHGDASLGMHLVDAALDAHSRRYPLLEEQRQQVTFTRADLFSNNQLKAILALLYQIASVEGSLDGVVIGDGNDIQGSALLGKIQHVFYRAASITVRRMHMQIGQATIGVLGYREVMTPRRYGSRLGYELPIPTPVVLWSCVGQPVPYPSTAPPPARSLAAESVMCIVCQ